MIEAGMAYALRSNNRCLGWVSLPVKVLPGHSQITVMTTDFEHFCVGKILCRQLGKNSLRSLMCHRAVRGAGKRGRAAKIRAGRYSSFEIRGRAPRPAVPF